LPLKPTNRTQPSKNKKGGKDDNQIQFEQNLLEKLEAHLLEGFWIKNENWSFREIEFINT
jgi:hypothetical protein